MHISWGFQITCSHPDIADDSLISGPLSLKSYTTVADFTDKKTKFSFKEGTTVQLIQKDPGGECGDCIMESSSHSGVWPHT